MKERIEIKIDGELKEVLQRHAEENYTTITALITRYAYSLKKRTSENGQHQLSEKLGRPPEKLSQKTKFETSEEEKRKTSFQILQEGGYCTDLLWGHGKSLAKFALFDASGKEVREVPCWKLEESLEKKGYRLSYSPKDSRRCYLKKITKDSVA